MRKEQRRELFKPKNPAPGTLLFAASLNRNSATKSQSISAAAVQGTRLPRHPKNKEIMNSTRNMTNRSFAMPADAAAMPPNPKIAATIAIIKKTTAQPSMFHLL
jgi:hypothetical protein